jgi:hypothetical protein
MSTMLKRVLVGWTVLIPLSLAAWGQAIPVTSPEQPLRLSAKNPHYFEFRGKPLVLITSAEHYGAVLNPDFNYIRYLDALQKDGLNLTRLFVGGYREVPGSFGIKNNTLAPAIGRLHSPWARSSEAGYSQGGNKFDLNRWNDSYFARLKDFIVEAKRRNIFVEVTFTSSLYNEAIWSAHPLHPDNNVNGTTLRDYKRVHTLNNEGLLEHQEKLLRKIVRELNTLTNFYFEIQNEPWADRTVTVDVVNPYLKPPALRQFPNSVDVADEESLAWQRRMAAIIVEEESRTPNRHLIAQNHCNFGCVLDSIDGNISIVNFHYAFPHSATSNYGWNKVLGYDETGFLGEHTDAGYRKQAWNFILSGGAVFNNLDYSFVVGSEDGTHVEPNGPGGGSPELRRQLGILKRFLEAFDLNGLAPANLAHLHAPGAMVRALASEGREYAMYLAGKGPVSLGFTAPAGRYEVRWVSTTTGLRYPPAIVDHKGGVMTLASPGFEEDIAVGIRRRGAVAKGRGGQE